MIRNALSFIAVVRAGSFSKAANAIGVSKAQLSRHVQQLETSLGIQLLHRTTRSLSLTESGEAFYQNCLTVEESYNEAVDKLKQDFHSIRGTLRITTTISFGTELFPKIIHQFTQQYPNITVVLSLSSINEDLIDQNFDLAIRVASTLPNSNLRMRKLTEFDTIICAAPFFFQNQSIPTQPGQLKDYRCITSINRNTDVQKIQWPFLINNKVVKYATHSVIEVDSLRAQIELISQGAGIGRIPAFFIEDELKAGKLIEVMADIKQPKSFAYLLYPNRKILPKKTQVFIDFLKDKIDSIYFE